MTDTFKKEAVEMLQEMIRIPSLSFEEKEVSDFLFSLYSSWGLSPERVNLNIICRQPGYDSGCPSLLLCAHMDTVPANNGYTFDPHEPLQEDCPGKIFGLGSNDDGGSVAAMTAAFRILREEKLPFNLILAITVEEERSGPDGMKYLWQNVFSGQEIRAIVGEPTGMRAAIAERGLLVIDGVAHGKSGHAARGEGINALYIALEDIEKLRSHKFAKISPCMGEVHLSVTQINAGTAHNVIPDLCSFVVDIRPTEKYGNEEILETLQAECRSELKARNLTNRSSATFEGSPLLACARALGIETFSSPTTSDWMRLGCDAVKMGPGDSSRSHKADEYLLVSELEDAVDKYVKFIRYYGNTLE